MLKLYLATVVIAFVRWNRRRSRPITSSVDEANMAPVITLAGW